jgi:hypothetical protein
VTSDIFDNAISGVTYNIYRAINSPYFAPSGAPYDTTSSPPYTDPDTGVIGDPNNSYQYVVVAVDNSGHESDFSNRVGVFTFPVRPGN